MAVGIAGQKALGEAQGPIGYFDDARGDQPSPRAANFLLSLCRATCGERGLPVPEIVRAGIRRRRPAVSRRPVIEELNSRAALGTEPTDMQPRAIHVVQML